MTAKGFTILSQVMIYDRSANPEICKHASLDRRRPLSVKDIWSFQCFQGRKLFVYEGQSPVQEDVQAKILKESLLQGWNTTHESMGDREYLRVERAPFEEDG